VSRFRRVLKAVHPEGIPGLGTRLYNAVSRTTIFQRHYELLARDILACCSTGRILDIGTGPAWLLIALHRLAPQLSLIGIDVSAAMVERARRNLEEAGLLGTIEVREAGAGHLPFRDESFEAVVSTGSIHHWKEPTACLLEAYRVLKPGGHALLYDVVADTPRDVLAENAARYGRLRMLLFWLHSFEEPFYDREEFEALATPTPFGRADMRWVGVLCCLALRKAAA